MTNGLPEIITSSFKSSPIFKSNKGSRKLFSPLVENHKHFDFEEPKNLQIPISFTKFSSPIQRYKPSDRLISNKNSPKTSLESNSPVENARGFEAIL